jgi:MFS family permease
MFGAIVFLPVYLQIVRGVSPTQSGLELLPLMVGLLVASVVSGRRITTTGRYKRFPIAGTAITAVGLSLLSTLGADTPYWRTALFMLTLGVGIGLVMQVIVLAMQNSVNPSDMGVATSSATFFRSLGGTFGTALFGTVLANRLASELAQRLPAGALHGINPSQLTGSPQVIAALPHGVRERGLLVRIVSKYGVRVRCPDCVDCLRADLVPPGDQAARARWRRLHRVGGASSLDLSLFRKTKGSLDLSFRRSGLIVVGVSDRP